MEDFDLRLSGLLLTVLGVLTPTLWGETPAGTEFFETKIRPVLVKNCYACHSSAIKTPMGGLFLDTKNGLLKGGTNGPAVVPGQPEKSALLKAIRYEGRKMPPSAQLPESVAADFEKWIAMGAPDPREGATVSWKPTGIDLEKGRKYWAFQPPQKPALPKVHNTKWSSAPIDRILLAKMEEKHIAPVGDADRTTWLRRVSFDLIGLPPTPEEIDSFLQDKSKDAYAKVVDRLLSSDRFGERWGRHWLDVARYAESVGRGRNYPFPMAWRYRNYVIDALNHDKPYDQFVREQIAGDLLPASSEKQRDEQLIATGFLSLGSHDMIEINPQIFRMDVVDEQINATTRSFMGLTVGCARCHDHKFDPIPTTDYYAMAGIFKSTEMLSGLQRRPRDNVSYFNIELLAKLDDAKPAQMSPEKQEKWEKLQAEHKDMLDNPRKYLQGAGPGKAGQNAKIRQITSRVLQQLDQFPLPGDLAMAVRDSAKPDDCEVHVRGDVQDLGPKVPRGFVQVASKPGEKAQIGANESGRLELAQWLGSRENPLVARVYVNRIWEHLFGNGIVRTVDNFGKMGEQPSNQQLLDYLATRFMEQGWSTKKMIREIALSRAYRLSTTYDARKAKVDPDNALIWRQNRHRLEVEAIRDSLLMVAGRLELNPPENSPVLNFGRGFDIGRGRRTDVADYATKLNCRSVYVPVLRNHLPAMYETFDFPEPSETKGLREVTTVPTQALFLMNSAFVLEQAKNAADKLLKAGEASEQDRINKAYREVLGRSPSAEELKRSTEYMKSGEDKTAWSRLYQALFASAEFRYRS